MTDTERLNEVMNLLKQEFEKMKKALKNDCEYNSLGGNGLNCCEVYGAMEPIYKRCQKIVKG